MSKYNLSWYVYRQNSNPGTIEGWNIFEHWRFTEDVIANIERFHNSPCAEEDKIAFMAQIKSDLMYYFWSKAEYEIILKNWIGKDCEIKIDVYDQVMLNFDKFIDYLWGVKNNG